MWNRRRRVPIQPVLVGAGEREHPERLCREGAEYRCGTRWRTGSCSEEAPVTGVERRGRVVRDCVDRINRAVSGRSSVDQLKSQTKPFEISKWEVKEAWEEVRANRGAPGVDGQSIADFEKDLKNNLYKVWTRWIEQRSTDLAYPGHRHDGGGRYPPLRRPSQGSRPGGGGGAVCCEASRTISSLGSAAPSRPIRPTSSPLSTSCWPSSCNPCEGPAMPPPRPRGHVPVCLAAPRGVRQRHIT